MSTLASISDSQLSVCMAFAYNEAMRLAIINPVKAAEQYDEYIKYQSEYECRQRAKIEYEISKEASTYTTTDGRS